MRSTLDLIRELESEAAKFTALALIVGFEEHSEYVWNADGTAEQKLQKLNEMIGRGGKPVGFVGYVHQQEQGERKFYMRTTSTSCLRSS